MTRAQMRRAVRAEMRGCGLRAFVRRLGLSEGHATRLGAFLAGRATLSPALLKALGYRTTKTETYTRHPAP